MIKPAIRKDEIPMLPLLEDSVMEMDLLNLLIKNNIMTKNSTVIN